MIVIDRQSPMPFYRQIHQQVASGIEAGVYRMGDRLPSIRSFALELGVSRNTVEQAYLLLVQEGYVNARQGSGYYISRSEQPRKAEHNYSGTHHAALRKLQALGEAGTPVGLRYDFSPAGIEAASFPFYRWARISREVMLDESRGAACAPMDPRGLREFREQIVRYLDKQHGITTAPEQVAVYPTVSRAIASALRLLAEEGFTAVYDDPCHPRAAAAIRESGIPAIADPLGSDGRWGSILRETRAHVVRYTAPENRFPANQAMSGEEREALLRWAAKTDSYLLEDGYGREFGRARALPSLHAADNRDRTIAVGSFEESLSPSMGVAWLVLPPHLMLRWLKRTIPREQVPWQHQAIFAEFMRQGLWDAHLRRLQTSYRHKQETLTHAVRHYLGDAVDCPDPEGGMYTLLQVKDGRGERELVEAGAQRGIRIYPTSGAWNTPCPPWWNHVLLGHAAIPLEDIEPGIADLARAWFG